MTSHRPVVGIAASRRTNDVMVVHAVSENYVTSILNCSGGYPILLPALEDTDSLEDVVSGIDGICLTGGASNIQPHLYDEEPEPESGDRDPGRDATAITLTRLCLQMGIPLLGICRGIQEMNVALGGSLWQHLKDAPGKFDHRRWRWRDQSMDVQLQPRHGIALRPGGMLKDILGGAREVKINSLHGQGVKRLGNGLMVEATAADGTIEAVSVQNARSFALGVQWHAEYKPEEFPVHEAIFRAFGDACRQRRAERDT